MKGSCSTQVESTRSSKPRRLGFPQCIAKQQAEAHPFIAEVCASFQAYCQFVRYTACFSKEYKSVFSTGPVRCQASGKQPLEQPDDTELSPDISSLCPDLQQEWHVGKNAHFGSIKIMPMSSKRAVLKCKKCPAGQPHVWSAVIKSRTRGSECPYCLNRDVCLHNSLATVAPQVAKYWNRSKNARAPHQVLGGSGARAEWKCPDCKWEWQARVAMRVSQKPVVRNAL